MDGGKLLGESQRYFSAVRSVYPRPLKGSQGFSLLHSILFPVMKRTLYTVPYSFC